MSSRIGDPLFSDQRLANVESIVRVGVPSLPQGVKFVTYALERGPAKVDGLVYDNFQEMACFAIVGPNPKDPRLELMEQAQSTWRQWKSWDRDYGRTPGVADPAIAIFVMVAQRYAGLHRHYKTIN